jgi:hypothetical protein
LTEPAISLAFFDAEREVHGMARAGLTLLFSGKSPRTLSEPAAIKRHGETYRVGGEDLELTLEPASEPIELDGSSVRLCRATGRVGEARIDGLGTATETRRPPAWEELDALRALSAIFDERHAVLVLARRPRGAVGHGDELVSAALIADEEVRSVENARLSTVYDGEGRQRNAGLELWLPGEDFPRRASGSVSAGASLTLEGLRVNAAVFDWHMEGRAGAGEYSVIVRDEPAAA